MNPTSVSAMLQQAIERLFDDPSVAYGALGLDRKDPDDMYEPPCDSTIQPIQRVLTLRNNLEKFIQQMSHEHDEMDSPEASDTLRMQAVGVLIALRELLRHFPELRGER